MCFLSAFCNYNIVGCFLNDPSDHFTFLSCLLDGFFVSLMGFVSLILCARLMIFGGRRKLFVSIMAFLGLCSSVKFCNLFSILFLRFHGELSSRRGKCKPGVIFLHAIIILSNCLERLF